MIDRLDAPERNRMAGGRLALALPLVLPVLAILAARLLTFTDWAAANPGWSAVLFAWIVLDALLLAAIAKAPRYRPAAFSVLAALGLASVVILAGPAAEVRAVYLGLPQVLIAAVGTIALFAGWSVWRIAKAYRATGDVESALGEVVPSLLARHIVAECRTVILALFQWGRPAHVPDGSRPFVYHTYLTPMIATFIALQVIELSVVHLLVMLWNPTVAWVLLALSLWGVIWSVALLKSFRINPVLLTDDHVRVRSGMIYDFIVPRSAIASWDRPFDAGELEKKSVVNLALMSSPNVALRFAEPVAIPTFFGGERRIEGVALRLDDSAGFVAALAD